MRHLLLSFSFLLVATVCHSQEKTVHDVARKGTLLEIQALYNKNPESIDVANDTKATPLILSCYRNNEPVALFLMDKVSNINYNSGMGTALMAAIMSGNTVIIEKLIAKKADLDQVDSQGKTALIYAVFNNNAEVARLLVQAGANVKIADQENRTALEYARFNKNTQLIILLDH